MDTILVRQFKSFAKTACDEPLSITEISSSPLYDLFDHGFIVDQAPVWSDSKLEGSEIAIVSRTYIHSEHYDFYPGLKIIQLPELTQYFSNDAVPSTVIATVINFDCDNPEYDQKSINNINSFLDACHYLSVYDLSHVLHEECHDRYYIGVFQSFYQTTLRIINNT